MDLTTFFSGLFTFSTAMSLIILSVILIIRVVKQARSQCHKRFKNVVKTILIHYLTSTCESIYFGSIERLIRIIKTKSQKQVVISILEYLCAHFQGSFTNKIQIIYEILNLHTVSLQKLNSNKGVTIVSGIRELAAMKYREGLKNILAFCQSENPTVRAEAYIASIQLADDPLYFLDSVKSLTMWEEINVIHHLQRLPLVSIPSVNKWLNSPKKAIVKFCLKIISEFGQYECLGQVHKLLKSEDNKITLNAINTLKNLRSVNSSKLIMDLVYNHNNIHMKVNAFDALLAIGVTDDITQVARKFLDSPIEKLRKIASSALVDIIKADTNLPLPELAPFLAKSAA